MPDTSHLSRQQRLMNAWARHVQKPTLHYTKSIKLLRWMTDLTVPISYQRPPNLLQKPMTLSHTGAQVGATACYIKHQTMDGTLMYLHGGGFVMGSLAMYRHLVASLGQAADMRGVYIDYRLAPEHPFPAALEDAVTAYQALLADPDAGPIAIAGDSAGGNLVLALLLKIKAMDLRPPFAAITIAPITDATLGAESLTKNQSTELLLDPDWGLRSIKGYIAGHDTTDPFLSPVRGNFTGAPPVAVHYDENEVLADDGAAIVRRLREQGVEVETEVTRGLPHVWHLAVGRTPEANRGVAKLGAFLKAHRPQA